MYSLKIFYNVKNPNFIANNTKFIIDIPIFTGFFICLCLLLMTKLNFSINSFADLAFFFI